MMSENRNVSERHGDGDFGRGAPMPVLSCAGLQLSYGSTLALGSVDLRVSAGESVAVLGPSGSGKSTLLHCLAGLRVPDRGEVRVGNEVLSSMPDRRRSRLRLERMGVVFQFGELLPELTMEENVGLRRLCQRLLIARCSEMKQIAAVSSENCDDNKLQPLSLSGSGCGESEAIHDLIPDIALADPFDFRTNGSSRLEADYRIHPDRLPQTTRRSPLVVRRVE